MNRIALFTTFYHAKHEIRNQENMFCLKKNIANPLIDRIFVFNESSNLPEHKKITAITFNHPTYDDCIKWANKEGYQYSVISNTDIFFDSTLSLLKKMQPNDAYVLARHEYHTGQLCVTAQGSQDVWIFKGQIKGIKGNFEMGGVPGCDNRIAYEIQQAGYNTLNPCLSIKAWHNHKSAIRYYDRSRVIQPPYINVWPCAL